MEQSFLIDTNIIIDIFKPSIPSLVKSKLADIPLVVSAVTYMEILGWPNATEQQLKPIQEFMNNAKILLIDKPVMETTIKIRQMKKIALGDAIITATALVHKSSTCRAGFHFSIHVQVPSHSIISFNVS